MTSQLTLFASCRALKVARHGIVELMTRGVVREWHPHEGWGVLDSSETPEGCWAHFSSLDMAGYATAVPGQLVDFTFEVVEQDGFHYQAVIVRIDGIAPKPQVLQQNSDACSSGLRIDCDDLD